MNHLRLGTRKSALAQAQARWVGQRLQEAHPGIFIEYLLITTSGDRGQTTAPGGLKALFTKEIEEALLANRIDLAVHSAKDLAAEMPAGLHLAAVPPREDARDVWVSKQGVAFAALPKRAIVATGAVRRQAQLRHLRPDLQLVPLRGNVDTRLEKLKQESFDGMILALAGLKRLGRESAVTEILSLDQMLPAVGQGALAIQTRAGDKATLDAVAPLDNRASYQALIAERAFLNALGGSCQTPIAGYAQISGATLRLEGVVAGNSGEPYYRESESGAISEAAAVGEKLAKRLLAAGAGRIF
jgi:hydroxymethylbilane synthase